MTIEDQVSQGLAVYADWAPRYRALSYEPIPVLGKFPVPSGCTGRDGTVTDEKVEEWRNDATWKDENVAIRANGWIAIDVDDYAEKSGAESLAKLEASISPLPATITSTSRGQESRSRHHFFRVPADMQFVTRLAEDIEVIQRFHRYAVVAGSVHPSTGEFYSWYGYEGEPLEDIPSISDFEELPEEWLFALRKSEADRSFEGFHGSIDEWLNTLEDGETSEKVRRWMSRLPLSDFTHDDVVRVTFELVRLGAEGNAGVREAMSFLWSKWVRGAYAEERYVAELEVAILGAIKKAGKREEPETLPFTPISFFDAQAQVPSDKNDELNRLVFKQDQLGPLLRFLTDLGLSNEVIYAIALGSTAAKRFKDGREVELWHEVEKYVAPPVNVGHQRGEAFKLSLLDDDRRAEVEEMVNAHTIYIEYAREKLGQAFNEPFNRANGWLLMSLMLGDKARAPLGDDGMALNTWWHILGDSSSGKGSSWRILKGVLDDILRPEPDWALGDDMSKEVLHDELISREGAACVFNSDEAGALWKNVFRKTGDWQTGLARKLSDWYDGWIGPMKRRGQSSEENARSGPATLCAHFMATPDDAIDNLNLDEFKSGFLARVMWVWGERVENENRDYAPSMSSDSTLTQGYDSQRRAMSSWWAVRSLMVSSFSVGRPLVVQASKRATQHIVRAGTKMQQAFKHRPTAMIPVFDAVVNRMLDVVWKNAALLALSDGRKEISVDDADYVLMEAERWLSDAVRTISLVGETPFAREVEAMSEDIERLSERYGNRIPGTVFWNLYSRPPRETLERRNLLEKRGEIVVDSAEVTGVEIIRWLGKQ